MWLSRENRTSYILSDRLHRVSLSLPLSLSLSHTHTHTHTKNFYLIQQTYFHILSHRQRILLTVSELCFLWFKNIYIYIASISNIRLIPLSIFKEEKQTFKCRNPLSTAVITSSFTRNEIKKTINIYINSCEYFSLMTARINTGIFVIRKIKPCLVTTW